MQNQRSQNGDSPIFFLGCVAEYFDDGQKTTSAPVQNLQAYKCVLNSKATEESMVGYRVLACWFSCNCLASINTGWLNMVIGISVGQFCCMGACSW